MRDGSTPAVFIAGARRYVADTCEPLETAASNGEIALNAWVHGRYPGEAMPADHVPEIATVGYWDARRQQTWGLDWHYNEGIEFTYLEAGRLSFSCEDDEYRLGAGALTITRPWQRHRVGRPYVDSSLLSWLILDVGVRRPNQAWQWPEWLICDEQDLYRLETVLRQDENAVWFGTDDARRVFRTLIKLTSEPCSSRGVRRLKVCVNDLLVALLEAIEREEPVLDRSLSSSARTVSLFLSRLPERIDEEWTLQRMARECGLGRSRFATLCLEATNMTPNAYLSHCRIQTAKAILSSDPTRSITDVAYATGFASSQHFATVFRQRAGTTPSEFRASQLPGLRPRSG